MMKHPLDTDEGVLLWEGLMLCCTAVLHAHDVERRRVPWEVLVAARRLGRWMIESVFGLEGIERWKSGQAIFTEKRTH